MATAYSTMTFATPFAASNQCIDPSEMDTFVDFGSMPSPTLSNANGKAPMMSRTHSAVTSPTNTVTALDFEEQQIPTKPSHEYERFKQQTGLPSGSYASLSGIPNDFDSFNPSMGGELGIGSSSMFGAMGSNSGLAVDTDMGYDGMQSPSGLPAFFFTGHQQDYVDPSAISTQEEQAQANIRFYPGMHQQQAAMAKAQQQAHQQRQQQMIQQAQKQRAAEQPRNSKPGHRPRKSISPIDARTEETIARVVNQIRQNNSSGSQDAGSPGSVIQNLCRSKKDEEDMDEDERLLASEDGKKLSSKERRQLRNKVSARAFRSRRKEYIGQLEGEVAVKVNEANELKNQNRALIEENTRFRELTIKLLRHPAFTPFLDDISRDPALTDSLNKVTSSMNATAATQSEASKDVKPFLATVSHQQQQQQHQQQQQQPEHLHIGMATIPDSQLDFSTLNINGGNSWAMPGMNGFGGGYQPQVFAVTELPAGPAEPLELGSIKGEESIIERYTPTDETKEPLPTAEKATEADVAEAKVDRTVELDDSFDLYHDAAATAAEAPASSPVPLHILGDFASEKMFGYELVVLTAESGELLERRLRSLTARAERLCAGLDAASSF